MNLFVNLLVCKLRPILITKTEKKQSHGSEQNIISPTPSALKVHSVYFNNLRLTRRHHRHRTGMMESSPLDKYLLMSDDDVKLSEV